MIRYIGSPSFVGTLLASSKLAMHANPRCASLERVDSSIRSKPTGLPAVYDDLKIFILYASTIVAFVPFATIQP